MIGIIPEIYCTNCAHAHIYKKAFCLEKILMCTKGINQDVNLITQNPPPACNQVKLISKLGDD